MPKPDELATVKFEFHDNPVITPSVGGYTQYFVTANGFVIASFVDEISLLSYRDYLVKYGLEKFPKNVLDIIFEMGRRNPNDVIELPKKN